MKFRFRPYLAALSAMVFAIAGVCFVDSSEQKRFQQEQRADVINQISTIRTKLESGLTSRIFLTKGLVAYISINQDITQAEFDRLVSAIVAGQTGISNIILYKNNAITHIYPYKVNKKLIADRYQFFPDQQEAIARAMKTRNTVVTEPVNLFKGSVSLISHTPIFLSPAGKTPKTSSYWGLAAIIIDKDTLFKEAGLIREKENPPSPLKFALRNKDSLGAKKTVFFGKNTIFEQNPVILEVNFPNGSWELAAVPAAGWPSVAPISGWLRTGGGLFALLTGILVFMLMRSPEQMQTAVAEATTSLRASEAKYRELVENANSIILRVDTQGNITFFNEFAQIFFGYSESEILGKNIVEAIVPATNNSRINLPVMIDKIVQNPERYTDYENEHIRRNGEPVWVAWRNKPLFDQNGVFTGILAIGNDISDRKIAEAKLQESEQKFRTLYESTIDAVMLINEIGFFDCNQATLQMFGCTNKEQFCGRSPSEFSPEFQPNGEKSSELSAERIATAFKEGSCRFEWVHRRLDGTEFPAEVWLTAIDWNIGNQTKQPQEIQNLSFPSTQLVLQAVVRDISKRKARIEALHKSQQMLQLVMDNIPQAIFWKDKNLVFLGGNHKLATDVGLASTAEIIGKTDYDLSCTKEQADLYREIDRRIIETGTASYHIIENLRLANGQIAWLDTSKVPLYDAEGNVIGILGTYEDITERKRTEEALLESERRLRRQSHALLDLASRNTFVNGDLNVAIRQITEVATDTLEVERASIWLYNEDKSSLNCLDLYQLNTGLHSDGIELKSAEYPAYFAALKTERIIAASDAHNDLRTYEFSASYLTPFGINSMLDAPIRVGGKMVGVICNEHIGPFRQWALEEQHFASSLADFVALAIEVASRKQAQEELQKAYQELETRVEERTAALRETNKDLRIEIVERQRSEKALRYQQEQTERLLLNILPQRIAERLRLEQTTIADSFEAVTVLFADIVGFTELSAHIPPVELVELLNEIFCTFDALTDQYGLEKIKTIGDAYMVVGGLPTPRKDHAEAVAEMAINMQNELQQFNNETGTNVQLRVGISTGPVVAGVIGIKKFIYDLWGDTVNTASRMESHGIAGKIQVTTTTYELLKDKYFFEERGPIPIKGKGDMNTYFLQGKIGRISDNDI